MRVRWQMRCWWKEHSARPSCSLPFTEETAWTSQLVNTFTWDNM